VFSTQLENARKSYVKGFSVSVAHKNKIPTAIRMLSGVKRFNGNNIHIARCRRHTGNKCGGKKSRSSFSLAGVAHTPAMQDCNRMF